MIANQNEYGNQVSNLVGSWIRDILLYGNQKELQF